MRATVEGAIGSPTARQTFAVGRKTALWAEKTERDEGGKPVNPLVALAFAGLIWAAPVGRVHADISTTQHLPTAACNQGTMNAHSHTPPIPISDVRFQIE